MTESRTVTLPTQVPGPRPDLARPHFVGIGGAGMSGLARLCAARGVQVTGSDADRSRLAPLAEAGCTVHAGHDAGHLRGASCVVVSTAIPDSNPEAAAAREAGIPVVHRAQVLQALMDCSMGVAVAGTHGKSTTTAMLATAMTALGMDPSYVMGASLLSTGSNAQHGTGRVFIAEADESDRSFCWLHPDLAVILNVDHDHPENYTDLSDQVDAYTAFARGITPDGILVTDADDAGARTLAARLRSDGTPVRIVTYGAAPEADWHILGITGHGMGSTTEVLAPDGQHLLVTLQIPGRHIARNAVAALAAATGAGASPENTAHALGSFTGVSRRLATHGVISNIRVLDSFAHHPAAVSADLETARSLAAPNAKVIVVFQPCGYARTLVYAERFATALAAADVTLLLEIHSSVGEPIPAVSSGLIARAGTGQVSTADESVDRVAVEARAGDVVLTMGTGDVTLLGGRIRAALAALQSASR